MSETPLPRSINCAWHVVSSSNTNTLFSLALTSLTPFLFFLCYYTEYKSPSLSFYWWFTAPFCIGPVIAPSNRKKWGKMLITIIIQLLTLKAEFKTFAGIWIEPIELRILKTNYIILRKNDSLLNLPINELKMKMAEKWAQRKKGLQLHFLSQVFMWRQ